jgi:hypothetical protein
MNPYVRDRIARKLDTLSDERLYQVLDYVEFLEGKYAEKPAPVVNVFQRFAEGVEDKLRAGGVAVSTVSETMGFLNKAMGVLNGVAQSTVAVGRDVVTAAKNAADQVGAPPTASGGAGAAPGAGVSPTPAPVSPTAAGGTQPAPSNGSASGPGMPPAPATPPETGA